MLKAEIEAKILVSRPVQSRGLNITDTYPKPDCNPTVITDPHIWPYSSSNYHRSDTPRISARLRILWRALLPMMVCVCGIALCWTQTSLTVAL